MSLKKVKVIEEIETKAAEAYLFFYKSPKLIPEWVKKTKNFRDFCTKKGYTFDQEVTVLEYPGCFFCIF